MTKKLKPALWLGLMPLLLVAACSPSPKQQAIDGFVNGCNKVDDPEVHAYCDCMEAKLDEAIPAKIFNNPDYDPMMLMTAFAQTTRQLMPQCKKGTGAEEEKSEPAKEPEPALPETSAPTAASTTPEIVSTPNTHAEAVAEAIEAAQQRQLAPPPPTRPEPSEADSAAISPEWQSVRQQIEANSDQYVSNCVAQFTKSAQELGGVDPAQNDQGPFCRGLLADLRNCMRLSPASSQRCYDERTQDLE